MEETKSFFHELINPLPLLINEEVEPDMAVLETKDFHNTFHQDGENSVTLEDIEFWLEADEDNPGYQILTEEKIIEIVIAAESFEPDKYDQDEAGDIINTKPELVKLKTI